ncbi:MAG: transketolase family protein [Limnochordia bacterium]|jgi:transketolase|nr:transketolase family protein [Bacillota bacterium]
MKAKALRDAFGEALVELGRENEDVVVMDADVAGSTRTKMFGDVYPDRFFNVGIAEANMMNIAAGLAACGKIPFVSTFSFLACLRAGDQLRTSIAYPRLNVKVGAGYGGLSDSFDGPTHHSLCDIAVVRSMPNMTVVVVSDPNQTKKAVKAVAAYDGPVYLRLSRAEVPYVLPEDAPFVIGKGNLLRNGSDLTLVVAGVPLARTMEAAERLAKEGVQARVIEMPTIKPIDRELLVEAARETGAVVTVEEHNIMGGLGSAVAEVLAQEAPVPMEFVGIKDTFCESGPYEALLDRYGLSVDDIVAAAKAVLSRKS